MRVWIVNPFDNLPAEGFRPQRYWMMARAFALSGDDVTLWSTDFSHAFKRPRRLALPPAGEGFSVRLLHVPSYSRNICLRRVFSHWRFAAAFAAAAREQPPPDVVIASMPPLRAPMAALRFCRRTGARFVLDVMDAWPETFYRLAPRSLFWPLRRIAGELYRSADFVTAVASRYVDLAASYGSTVPSRLFHHGIELDYPLPPLAPCATNGGVRLVYVGNMGASYDLETVIDAVKAEVSLELDIAGTGPKEGVLRTRAEGCSRIRFHGYLATDAMRELLARANVAIVPMFPDSCVGIPYKLADYAAAGLKVVSSLSGEIETLLKRFGAGVVYSAGNVSSFVDAVRMACVYDGFDREGFRSYFDAEAIYSGYVDFIKKGMTSDSGVISG